MELSVESFRNAISTLLKEIVLSPDIPTYTWVVSNEPQSGFLGSLANVSAERASVVPGQGRKSIASHVEHVRFVLATSNIWLRGEVPQVDWNESWRVSAVTAEQWDELRAQVKKECEIFQRAVMSNANWSEPMVTGIIGTTAHAAYHLGAVRQLLKETAG